MSNSKQLDAIYAFVDSQNLNLGVRYSGWELDFGKFRKYLSDKYKVEKAYLFIGHVVGNEELYIELQEAGYILIFKPTLEFKKGEQKFTKGNVDAELVLHTMKNMSNYHKAVIVSGDGDFHCLIEYLEGKGRLLKVIVPNDRYSSLIRKFAKYIVSVQKFRKKVEKDKTEKDKIVGDIS